MSPRLALLIEKARHYRMGPEERREQAISFAYGNARVENPRMTRELVVLAFEEGERRDGADTA